MTTTLRIDFFAGVNPSGRRDDPVLISDEEDAVDFGRADVIAIQEEVRRILRHHPGFTPPQDQSPLKRHLAEYRYARKKTRISPESMRMRCWMERVRARGDRSIELGLDDLDHISELARMPGLCGIRSFLMLDAEACQLALILEDDASLSELHFYKRSPFYPSVGDAGARAIALSLEKNTTLHTLRIQGHVEDDGANQFATSLSSNTSLRTLDLSFNHVGPEGVTNLSSALENNNALRDLNLGMNPLFLGDSGRVAAISLAAALRLNDGLRSLSLARSRLDDDALVIIARALGENRALESLDLRHNRIGDGGARAMASTLAENATLQTLNLADNRIGDAGTRDIASSMEKNATLCRLDLHGNIYGESGRRCFVEVCKSNTSLTSLDIDFGILCVADEMRKNRNLRSHGQSLSSACSQFFSFQ